MREIIFRGKDTDTGKWLYGSLLIDKGVAKIGRRERGHSSINQSYNYWVWYEVDPDTVGQYTVLKDKNGNKIFEEDIVREVVGYKRIGYIGWLQQECGFVIVWKESDSRLGHRSRGGGYENDPSLEVIGNIHDNPELLSNNKK